MSKKIIVSGSVNGDFQNFFDKIERLNSKNGPFDLLLCVGNFFGKNPENFIEFKKLNITPTIKTLLIVNGLNENLAFLENGGNGLEISPNIHFLGKFGIKEINGVKIAFLSGGEFTRLNIKNGVIDPTKYIENLKNLADNFNNINILLTHRWPAFLERLVTDEKISKQLSEIGDPPISSLSEKVAATYHFSGGKDFFYQSPAFINSITNSPCRFIGLADNSNSQLKNLFAFTIDPSQRSFKRKIDILSPFSNLNPFSKLNENEQKKTKCPKIRNLSAENKNFRWSFNSENYTCVMCNNKGHWEDECFLKEVNDLEMKETKKPFFKRRLEKNQCWFCKKDAIFERHLVVAEGQKCYLSIAKGGMSQYHCLICPLKHNERLFDCDQDTIDEIKMFQMSLIKMAQSKGLEAVFWDRFFVELSSHIFIECIFIKPKNRYELQDNFHFRCKDEELKILKFSPGEKVKKETLNFHSFMRLETSDGFREIAVVPNGKNLSPDFFRRIVSKAMGLKEDAANWRLSVKTKENEMEITSLFKSIFNEILK